MANLQVTRILPQHVCFCGYGSSGVQAARDSTAKLYSRGILRLFQNRSDFEQAYALALVVQ